MISKTREDFFQDIELIFQRALEDGQYQAALKAKEILGREKGFFHPQAPEWDFTQLSDQTLSRLIEKLSVQQKSRTIPEL